MANIDHDRKRITAVVLFYGPPGSGKTTSLYALSRSLPPGTHGKVQPLQAGDERLLRLDYRPHDQELVYGYQLSFRLVAAPGAIEVDLVRPVAAAADAIIFVADSAANALTSNQKALELLDKLVRGAGRKLDDVPTVFMYNKRDLQDALEIRVLESKLNRLGANYLAASALRGQGVLEALQRLTATVAVQLRTELQNHPGVAAQTAPTVAHGTTFQQARALHAGGLPGRDADDVTAVSMGRSGPPGWEGGGDDDKTEVNAQGDWEEEAAPQPPSRGRPAVSAPTALRDPDPEPLPRRAAAQPPPPASVGNEAWRTPERLAEDVDADDHTMPYLDFDGEVGEAPAAPRPEPRRSAQPPPAPAPVRPPPPRAVSQPRAQMPAAAPASAGYAMGRGAAPVSRESTGTASMRARRVEPPSAPMPGVVPGGASMRTPARAAEPAAPGGDAAFTKTMAINALSRDAEAWEAQLEASAHPVTVGVADLSGYIISRIGTPKASSRRTLRIPVRATHMDTLVPADFLLDIEFRADHPRGASAAPAHSGGGGVSKPWFFAAVFGLTAVVIALAVALGLK